MLESKIKKPKGIKRFSASVINSLSGLWYAYKNELSLRIHLVFMLVTIFLCIFFKVSTIELCIILLGNGVIIISELLNTSIESTVDLITKEFNPLAKIAKDCASSSSFIITSVVIIIELIIFINYFIYL